MNLSSARVCAAGARVAAKGVLDARPGDLRGFDNGFLCTGSDSDDSESDGEGGDGFEKIKSRMERKRDKLLSMDPNDVTYEMVAKKLREVIGLRGKKGIDRQEQVCRT